jgi:hypothetical protein
VGARGAAAAGEGSGAAAQDQGAADRDVGEQVEALAREGCPPGAAAEALGIATPNATSGVEAAVATAEADLPASGPGVGRWTRFDLGLGLELSVRDDASAAMRTLAARIREMCASNAARRATAG